jgi:hypothetical protein
MVVEENLEVTIYRINRSLLPRRCVIRVQKSRRPRSLPMFSEDLAG